MKKCPECGNPSYDGAPVCGNCGYNFPKQKVASPKSENIFQEKPKAKKTSNNDDTISIIRQNKVVIGAILIITLIVICGILLTAINNSNSNMTNDLLEYSAGEFTFKYPASWKEVNLTDGEHPNAKFFQNDNNTIIELYQVSSGSTSIKEISQNIISYAQGTGAYIYAVETTTLDGRNASNIIIESTNGNYTRYVSIFSDGASHVFKITGDSVNSVNSSDINDAIKTADIA